MASWMPGPSAPLIATVLGIDIFQKNIAIVIPDLSPTILMWKVLMEQYINPIHHKQLSSDPR